MVSTELKNIVESLIFASEEEINPRQIKDIIDRSGLRISIAETEEAVNVLNEEYKSSNKSFEILKIAGGFSFATKKEYGRFIGKLIEDKQRKKLSPSALETLAIIAYKQPITRSEMEFIRGVNVDYIVNSLLEKDMITIMGRAETPGRPILYGTTKTFLKVLGLNSLEDLPKLKEINEILKNQEIEGITEADIELFNSVNYPESGKVQDSGHQLELISSENSNETIAEDIEDDSSIDENVSEGNGIENTDSADDLVDETDAVNEGANETTFTEISEDTDNENMDNDISELRERKDEPFDIIDESDSVSEESEESLSNDDENFINKNDTETNESENKD